MSYSHSNTAAFNGPGLPLLSTVPPLIINYDVAENLDSADAFEGPEKLLEVWFAPDAHSFPATVKPNGLLSVAPVRWETMLDLVNCNVLSIAKSDQVDAYLLSESSMFVYAHKIVLKTCGTTTLLLGLPQLLRIAAVDAGFPFHNALSLEDADVGATPYRVFYSRKNFLHPERQRGPHRSWREEVEFLDDMFEGGSAYMMGKMNGDHWYLYITSAIDTLTPPLTPQSSEDGTSSAGTLARKCRIPAGRVSSFLLPPGGREVHDETLEILMTNLDLERAQQFYLADASAVAKARVAAAATAQVDGRMTEALSTEGHLLGSMVAETCGLANIYPKWMYPGSRLDAYQFAPCGFSANAVIPVPKHATGAKADSGKTDHYFTVHVTPEPHCSFASFETNVPGGVMGPETGDIIEQVIDIFRPGRFSVTLFQAKERAYVSDDGEDIVPLVGKRRKPRVERVNGYRRVDRIVHDFDDYEMIFRYYEREGWVNHGKTRFVGETF